jgi:hypothetical protein
MTALQTIIKEAKAIRKKMPKIEWKKAVAQASAIYASKHKGKSPVGKKKAVKKAPKKKYVGSVKKKAAKKVVRKKVARKKATTMHKDTKSHNVNIRVMSGLNGVGKFKKDLIKSYKITNENIIALQKEIGNYQQALRENKNAPVQVIKETKDYIKSMQSLLKEEKEHLRQYKKLL